MSIQRHLKDTPTRTGRTLAAYGLSNIPRTRPPKPVPIDAGLLKAWRDYMRANARARAAYYLDPQSTWRQAERVPDRSAS